MKKFVCIAAALALAISGVLCGCARTSDAEPGDTTRDGVIGYDTADDDMIGRRDTAMTDKSAGSGANGTTGKIGKGTSTTGGSSISGGKVGAGTGANVITNDMGANANSAN